jgi:hypothetical protein
MAITTQDDILRLVQLQSAEQRPMSLPQAAEVIPSDTERTSGARRLAWYGVAAGLLSIGLAFSVRLPWYDIRFVGCPGPHGACQISKVGIVSGLAIHGYLWAIIPITLVALVALLLLAGLHGLPLFRRQLARALSAAALMNALVVVLAFFTKPGYIPTPNPNHVPLAPVPPPILSVSWQYGAWLGLIMAAGAMAAAIQNTSFTFRLR